jgi:hypothetical protein
MQILYCGIDFSGMTAAAKELVSDSSSKFFSELNMSGEAFDIAPVSMDEEGEAIRSSEYADMGGGRTHRERSILEELDAIAYFSIHQTNFFCT